MKKKGYKIPKISFLEYNIPNSEIDKYLKKIEDIYNEIKISEDIIKKCENNIKKCKNNIEKCKKNIEEELNPEKNEIKIDKKITEVNKKFCLISKDYIWPIVKILLIFVLVVAIISYPNIDVYLFNWDDVFENNTKLIKFLKDDLKISWVKNAEIKKSDNNETITVTDKNNNTKVITIKLNKTEKKVNLEINDSGISYDYILKEEKGKLNIYANLKSLPDSYIEEITGFIFSVFIIVFIVILFRNFIFNEIPKRAYRRYLKIKFFVKQ